MNLFFGKSVNGAIEFSNKKAIRDFLLSVDNKTLVVQVDREYGVRSQNQNRYLFGVVYRVIAEHTGHTETEIHELMKRICLPPVYKKIMGREIKMPASTTKLSKNEFSDYVERIKAEVASLGLEIPEPVQSLKLF